MRVFFVAWPIRQAAPLQHPAFEDAVAVGDEWVVYYPIENKALLKGRKAQERFMQDKVAYLRCTWAITARMSFIVK